MGVCLKVSRVFTNKIFRLSTFTQTQDLTRLSVAYIINATNPNINELKVLPIVTTQPVIFLVTVFNERTILSLYNIQQNRWYVYENTRSDIIQII